MEPKTRRTAKVVQMELVFAAINEASNFSGIMVVQRLYESYGDIGR